ncbi:MAG: hypothetical protein NTU98_09110 [Bacteroidetes bacterium]|nr:hypothetical protein [Bacteroidota bacterium]
MNTDPADNDLIERYLLGKLTDKEISGFHARLGEDREFSRKFRLIKTFPEMMSEGGRIELEKKLTEAVDRVMEGKAPRFRKRRYLIWGSVSVIVLTGAILLIIFLGKNRKEQSASNEQNIIPKDTAVKIAIAAARKDTATLITQQSAKPEEKKMQESPVISGQKTAGLSAPDGGAKFSRKETILFKWTQKFDTFTRLSIYTEQGDKLMLWRGVTPGLQEYKVPGNYLMTGKFYWCVGTKEDRHSFVIIE